MKKIALFRALKLGDMLCAIPAIRAVRGNFPQAKIILMGLPWAKQIAERYRSYIDGFIEFPGFPGLPEQKPRLSALTKFLDRVREERFDLVLQIHGSGVVTNPLVMLFGGKKTFGFYLPGQFCPNPETFFPYPLGEREVSRNVRLLEKMRLTSQGLQLEFPLFKKDMVRAGDIYSYFGLKPKGFVCIHPGSISAKQWDLSKFAKVADSFSYWGLQPVLTGTESERYLTKRILQQMKSLAVDLCGKTDLGTLAAIIKDSRFLISNDTGVAHLADALSVPSVVIFINSNLKRWAPADNLLHKVVLSRRGDFEEVLSQAYRFKQTKV